MQNALLQSLHMLRWGLLAMLSMNCSSLKKKYMMLSRCDSPILTSICLQELRRMHRRWGPLGSNDGNSWKDALEDCYLGNSFQGLLWSARWFKEDPETEVLAPGLFTCWKVQFHWNWRPRVCWFSSANPRFYTGEQAFCCAVLETPMA